MRYIPGPPLSKQRWYRVAAFIVLFLLFFFLVIVATAEPLPDNGFPLPVYAVRTAAK